MTNFTIKIVSDTVCPVSLHSASTRKNDRANALNKKVVLCRQKAPRQSHLPLPLRPRLRIPNLLHLLAPILPQPALTQPGR